MIQRLATLLIMALVAWGITQHVGPNHTASPTRKTTTANAYPRARWRLAPPRDLDQTLLRVSHILIRHKDSDNGVPIGYDWKPLPRPPTRSREEALSLATKLYTTLAQSGSTAERCEAFEALATQQSDDLITRGSGGSLGDISAGSLIRYPEFLDALAQLAPGDVSRPVETSHGFSILLRRLPPDALSLSARRLVIPFKGDYASPARTAALQEATDIQRRLASEPEAFDTFLPKFAHPDDGPGGDIGVWSSSELGRLAFERTQLSKLPVGSVSQVVEGIDGFQIFLKTPVAPRERYAAEFVVFRYFGTEGKLSRASQLDAARAALAAIIADPKRMGDLQREHCCMRPETWWDGRQAAVIANAVKRLELDTVSHELIEVERNSSFLIARRLRPETLEPSVPPSFELPSPTRPDLVRLAAGAAGKQVQAIVLKIGADASRSLSLTPEVAAKLQERHAAFTGVFTSTRPGPEREEAAKRFFSDLSNILTVEQRQRYDEIAADIVTAELMAR